MWFTGQILCLEKEQTNQTNDVIAYLLCVWNTYCELSL